MEEREIRADRVRLKIVASQVIYDCKKDRYLLDYKSILKLSVLVGIAQLYRLGLPLKLNEYPSLAVIRNENLAFTTRNMVVNSFTSFYDNGKTWE